jgi:hypothetical protein
MESEIEITILPDGTLLVPRGFKDQNEMVRQLLIEEVADPEALSRFLAVADECQVLYGKSTYCG